MVSSLIVIFVIIALWHIIYEAVLLPIIRMHMRYKLFALRDKLRRLKIEHIYEFDDSVYNIVEENINNAINLLPLYTISFLKKIKNVVAHHPEMIKKIQNRVKKVESCEIEEVNKIARSSIKYANQTLIYNTGGWIIYFLPIIFILGIFKIFDHVARKFTFVKDISRLLVFTKNFKGFGIKPELAV